jgi:hypothetical protein
LEYDNPNLTKNKCVLPRGLWNYVIMAYD